MSFDNTKIVPVIIITATLLSLLVLLLLQSRYKADTHKDVSKSTMVVIKPNKINISKTFDPVMKSVTDRVSQLVNINETYIQYIESEYDGDLMPSFMHPLVEAVHQAYSTHLPLVLTPDAIWYCITSAIAVHINKYSEKLRNKFVDHEGKKKIEIRRDDFVLGSKTNPWNEVVDEFTAKIKEYTKSDIVDKLQADYSTTTKVARVVSQIVIMDAMQQYFDYSFRTTCGIPEIRIMGSKEDWQKIKQRSNELLDIMPELKKWIYSLNEILDQFINAYDNKINEKFWNQIYKIENQSGGPFITGWIISLFPYLKDQKKNRYCWDGKSWRDATGLFSGLVTTDLEYHINKVPFIWNYYLTEIKMLFIGGLLGVKVDKSDFALTPVFGYAVTENK